MLKRLSRALTAFKSTPKQLETKQVKKKMPQRRYEAAQFNNILADWVAGNTSANTEVYGGLVTIRSRARELERNNPYIQKYLSMCETNVVGSGFRLNMRVKNRDGSSDDMADRIIEESFAIWSRKKFASASGTMSFHDMQRLYQRTLDRDGEVIFRMHRGFDNNWGFAIQPIDVALLDEELNMTRPNGNTIVMGVELDKFERPLNYYFKNNFNNVIPNGADPFNSNGHTIIPANEIIHGKITERASQTRAVSPMSSVMTSLHQLDGYMNAELVASRVGACKMGFYTNTTGDEGSFDENEDPETMDGAWIDNAEPGIFQQLPNGWNVETFDPNHPSTAFKDFVKSELRNISSGLDVNYNMLASDGEGVNYSSLRGFVVADRDKWIIKQDQMIENFLRPVFEQWLSMSLISNAFPVPFKASDFNKFNKPFFQGRRWQWIDPLKDAQANVIQRDNTWKTDSQIASEQGNNLEDNAAIQEKDNNVSQVAREPFNDEGTGDSSTTIEEGEDDE